MIHTRIQRLGSIALAAGAILFGAASLFHPPTVNPWDPRISLAEAIHAAWIVDHWALLAAVTLVHFGLFAMHARMRVPRRGRYQPIAFALGIASLILWLAIFLFEATGWPILAKAIAAQGGLGAKTASGPAAGSWLQAAGGETILDTVARTLWAATLSLGYAAAFSLGPGHLALVARPCRV